MAKLDVFAFGKSTLNAFLFADVGVELNGSSLTVLSTLARLGDDPWLKAASWARMPRTAARAALATSIGGMPLRPMDLDAAPATAARLIDLLFASRAAEETAAKPALTIGRLRRAPGLVASLAIGLALVFALTVAHEVHNTGASTAGPAPLTQTSTDP